jgi:hypothetical protein
MPPKSLRGEKVIIFRSGRIRLYSRADLLPGLLQRVALVPIELLNSLLNLLLIFLYRGHVLLEISFLLLDTTFPPGSVLQLRRNRLTYPSIMFMTFGLTFFFMPSCAASSSLHFCRKAFASILLKSY